MRKVGIVGIGHTKFGKSEASFLELSCMSALEALEDASIPSWKNGKVDQVVLGTMGGFVSEHITGAASAVADMLGLCPAMAETVENGPASGASAVKTGYCAVASGLADCALVIGSERMSALPGPLATDFIATVLHPAAEYPYGLTLPAAAAMFARAYMEKYGVSSRDLSLLSVKNHRNACLNPNAQFQKEVDLETLESDPAKNPAVASPLRRYDVCPRSDGSAAVLLVAEDKLDALQIPREKFVEIAGIASATDTHSMAAREDPTELRAVRIAAERAYAMANCAPSDVDVAELHDAFLILELAISEEIGLFPRGSAHLAVRAGETALSGRIPVNPSGGLKAKGHPLGATGVSQIVELVRQLRGEAGPRQAAHARTGIAVNFGGFGNNVVATILKKGR